MMSINNQSIQFIGKALSAVLFLVVCQSAAMAKVTHVSINQQSFILGGYPNLRLNIVSEHDSLDKLQFIVLQSSGEERLMVKPINNFMLHLTGVEDINDPDAQLVIKEHRVNKWREVKRIALFNGDMKIPTELSETQTVAVAPVAKKPQSIATASQVAAPVVMQSNAHADLSCQLQTEPTQTLWRIGSNYAKQWQVNTYGAILAIYQANPKAFNKGNINSLRADVLLNCPTTAVIEQFANGASAKQQFERLSQGG
ncbi:hypothetical protein FLM48_19680 [Shewanella sp. Scap07]|uniref:FimV/HubP family polar landmark protein n=1 Tax=Shewanella sp. Scap07 TaxID=2589987 RepID=UPI0015BBC66F|nr:FimV/HubP family polar landmark protein [Shewanella sp. Scap07]QLE87098.1 hypothetical protein FLM48_19680 [Shewanella sp. Scap07]